MQPSVSAADVATPDESSTAAVSWGPIIVGAFAASFIASAAAALGGKQRDEEDFHSARK